MDYLNSITKNYENINIPQKSEKNLFSSIKYMSGNKKDCQEKTKKPDSPLKVTDCNNHTTKSNKIQFTTITNPFNLVNDPELFGNSEVYETHYEKLADAMQTTFLVKETKKGSPMRVHTTDIKRPKETDFKSMMGIYRTYRMFPLVECGKSSMRKDLIAVDIDERIDIPTFFDKLRAVGNIPECICTRHISTGHWQIQFYLKNPLFVRCIDLHEQNANGKYIPTVKRNENNHEVYIRTVKRFAKYFKGVFGGADLYYQGTMCRNPYNISQESYLFINNRFVSLKERRPSGNDFSVYTDFLNEKNVVLRKNINLDVQDIDEKNPELSRHKLTMIYAREWVWSNMRKGNVPTEDDLEQFLLESKIEIADKCMKEPHSDKEISGQVHSLYKWSVSNFKDKNETSGQWKSSVYWNRNQRSEKIKRAKKLKKNFLSLLAADYSLSEIAKIFGMSRPTLYSYMSIFFVMDTVKTVFWFEDVSVKFGGYKPWKEIIAEIGDKIKLLKMKYGESKIKWKELKYEVAEVNEHEVNYDIPLAGNFELDKRYIA